LQTSVGVRQLSTPSQVIEHEPTASVPHAFVHAIVAPR
jgi:hypothetical protein